MAVQLPGAFMSKMQELLGEEYERFMQTYQDAPYGGIRVNTLKITVERFRELAPFALESIPWCPGGFYTEEGARPGKHPYYHAGLYYIQEPSAMAPVELLNVQPGDRVLDLCAAPGGKSTQIAAKLQGKGMLVSNDLHPERTKALAKNLELYGVRNGIVLNESPERIAAAFTGFFDRILIDAPCSGEGMFRKDEDMVKQWNPDTPLKYAAMQREILASAAKALKPGGTMVYSTCTFAVEENEGMIGEFLAGHPEFTPVPAGGTGAFACGLGDVPEAARLWPHKVKGEGHFMAVLRHCGAAGVESGDTGTEAGYTGAKADGMGAEAGDAGAKADGMGAEAGYTETKAGDTGTDKPLRISGRGLPDSRGDGRGPGRLQAEREAKGQADRTKAGRAGKGGRSGSQSGGAGSRRVAGSADELFAAWAEFTRDQLGWTPAGQPVLFGEHLYLSPVPQEALAGLKTVRPGWYMGQVRNGRFIPGHPLATALRPEECRRSLSLSAAAGEAVSYLKGETLSIPAERLMLKEDCGAKGYVLVCVDGYSAGWGKWQDGILKNEYPAGWRWT
ncbi:RsmB/NOP family class I SAM-dependent RNA methyltransferase [Paenibacillus tengchongensis]|uniref:RsmB/NOP family class I SAM-dependent RNA methyltransferase n=1 Tax=Paenibacillus tengchongensis TaxID=2608684 RepID=UPI00124DA214|nr:RsmB/NOP family class I SAM-dependent RNA methyltransferase [Paenibacillus tengchongensis]